MKTRTLKILTTGAVALLLASAMAASASSITFESPTYSLGTLNGQDGWGQPSYASGTPSVVAPGLLGSGQAASASVSLYDAYRHMDTFTDGPGIDFYTSVLWQSSGGTSIFSLSDNGVNGASPVGLEINGNNIEYAGLSSSPYYVNFADGAGAYTIGDVEQFQIGVDIGGQTFTTQWRDMTTGGAWSTPETHSFWSLSAPSDYPQSGVPVDVLIGSRGGGTATWDDIVMTAVPEPSSLASLVPGLAVFALVRKMRRA